jgi:hypothetical protein
MVLLHFLSKLLFEGCNISSSFFCSFYLLKKFSNFLRRFYVVLEKISMSIERKKCPGKIVFYGILEIKMVSLYIGMSLLKTCSDSDIHSSFSSNISRYRTESGSGRFCRESRKCLSCPERYSIRCGSEGNILWVHSSACKDFSTSSESSSRSDSHRKRGSSRCKN